MRRMSSIVTAGTIKSLRPVIEETNLHQMSIKSLESLTSDEKQHFDKYVSDLTSKIETEVKRLAKFNSSDKNGNETMSFIYDALVREPFSLSIHNGVNRDLSEAIMSALLDVAKYKNEKDSEQKPRFKGSLSQFKSLQALSDYIEALDEKYGKTETASKTLFSFLKQIYSDKDVRGYLLPVNDETWEKMQALKKKDNRFGSWCIFRTKEYFKQYAKEYMLFTKKNEPYLLTDKHSRQVKDKSDDILTSPEPDQIKIFKFLYDKGYIDNSFFDVTRSTGHSDYTNLLPFAEEIGFTDEIAKEIANSEDTSKIADWPMHYLYNILTNDKMDEQDVIDSLAGFLSTHDLMNLKGKDLSVLSQAKRKMILDVIKPKDIPSDYEWLLDFVIDQIERLKPSDIDKILLMIEGLSNRPSKIDYTRQLIHAVGEDAFNREFQRHLRRFYDDGIGYKDLGLKMPVIPLLKGEDMDYGGASKFLREWMGNFGRTMPINYLVNLMRKQAYKDLAYDGVLYHILKEFNVKLTSAQFDKVLGFFSSGKTTRKEFVDDVEKGTDPYEYIKALSKTEALIRDASKHGVSFEDFVKNPYSPTEIDMDDQFFMEEHAKNYNSYGDKYLDWLKSKQSTRVSFRRPSAIGKMI